MKKLLVLLLAVSMLSVQSVNAEDVIIENPTCVPNDFTYGICKWVTDDAPMFVYRVTNNEQAMEQHTERVQQQESLEMQWLHTEFAKGSFSAQEYSKWMNKIEQRQQTRTMELNEVQTQNKGKTQTGIGI